MTDFWKALGSATIYPFILPHPSPNPSPPPSHTTHISGLFFPNYYLMGSPLRGQWVFIRACYQPLLQRIQTLRRQHVDNILITGTPGVGKSFFAYYLLYCLYHNPLCLGTTSRHIYYQEGRALFRIDCDSGNVFCINTNRITDPNSVLIADPGSRDAICSTSGVTIAMMSPSHLHKQEFEKRAGSRILYMPVVGVEEMKAMGWLCFPQISESDMLARYARWGGTIRYVLEQVGDTHQGKLQCVIDSLTARQCTSAYSYALREANDETSDMIVHLFVRPNSGFEVATPRFASAFIAQHVWLRVGEKERESVAKYTLTPEVLPTWKDSIFEHLAHPMLARNGYVRCSTGEVKLPNAHVYQFSCMPHDPVRWLASLPPLLIRAIAEGRPVYFKPYFPTSTTATSNGIDSWLASVNADELHISLYSMYRGGAIQKVSAESVICVVKLMRQLANTLNLRLIIDHIALVIPSAFWSWFRSFPGFEGMDDCKEREENGREYDREEEEEEVAHQKREKDVGDTEQDEGAEKEKEEEEDGQKEKEKEKDKEEQVMSASESVDANDSERHDKVETEKEAQPEPEEIAKRVQNEHRTLRHAATATIVEDVAKMSTTVIRINVKLTWSGRDFDGFWPAAAPSSLPENSTTDSLDTHDCANPLSPSESLSPIPPPPRPLQVPSKWQHSILGVNESDADV